MSSLPFNLTALSKVTKVGATSLSLDKPKQLISHIEDFQSTNNNNSSSSSTWKTTASLLFSSSAQVHPCLLVACQFLLSFSTSSYFLFLQLVWWIPSILLFFNWNQKVHKNQRQQHILCIFLPLDISTIIKESNWHSSLFSSSPTNSTLPSFTQTHQTRRAQKHSPCMIYTQWSQSIDISSSKLTIFLVSNVTLLLHSTLTSLIVPLHLS